MAVAEAKTQAEKAAADKAEVEEALVRKKATKAEEERVAAEQAESFAKLAGEKAAIEAEAAATAATGATAAAAAAHIQDTSMPPMSVSELAMIWGSSVLRQFCNRLPEVVSPSHLLRPRKLRPEVKVLLGALSLPHTHTYTSGRTSGGDEEERDAPQAEE
jgi:hypothetical protein